ncbi:MAG: hypothetical protein EBZ75_15150, partial [Oxalobacteraceae bacterium]|nr:hypothetical protein [Oxalobacteraceae bacterium]
VHGKTEHQAHVHPLEDGEERVARVFAELELREEMLAQIPRMMGEPREYELRRLPNPPNEFKLLSTRLKAISEKLDLENSPQFIDRHHHWVILRTAVAPSLRDDSYYNHIRGLIDYAQSNWQIAESSGKRSDIVLAASDLLRSHRLLLQIAWYITVDGSQERFRAIVDADRLLKDYEGKFAELEKMKVFQEVPALMRHFPQAQVALVRSAKACASAQAALAELAQMDMAACASSAPDSDFSCQGGVALALSHLVELSQPRRYNLLSHWLRAELQQRWPSGVLDELLSRLRLGACFRLPVGKLHELRCYRNQLQLQAISSCEIADEPAAQVLVVHGYGRYPCPQWGGYWWLRPAQSHELALPIDATKFQQTGMEWTVRGRCATDRFAKASTAAVRSLKKAYQ